MKPLYCIFYTRGTDYEQEAAQCVESLDQFRLEYDVAEVTACGSWVGNCALKAAVIAEVMRRYPDRPIVYLDADARVRRRPTLFETMPPDVDFAAHWRHGAELLSGTLYFGATARAAELVARWQQACESDPNRWDQKHLQDIVESSPDLRVLRLPAEYCRVFDDPKMGEPVIEQLQASRRLAAAVNA